jgi:hypothetical protein
VLSVRMVCNCRRLTAERKVWRGYARMELHGTRLRLPEDSKPYPLRLKKCQASHARHNERMLIMRRRSASGATAARVASLSMGGRCRGVGWGPKKVRCTDYGRPAAVTRGARPDGSFSNPQPNPAPTQLRNPPGCNLLSPLTPCAHTLTCAHTRPGSRRAREVVSPSLSHDLF